MGYRCIVLVYPYSIPSQANLDESARQLQYCVGQTPHQTVRTISRFAFPNAALHKSQRANTQLNFHLISHQATIFAVLGTCCGVSFSLSRFFSPFLLLFG